MTETPYNRQDSGEKIDSLLKKVAALEDMILMGNKVYLKERAADVTAALLQGRVAVKKPEILAGETFALEIEIANFGKAPATLDGIEEILPCCGMEMVSVPERCDLDGSYLDMHGRAIKPSTSERLQLQVRAFEKGIYAIAPRIVYSNGVGVPKALSLKPITVDVKEVVLTNRVSSGFKDLDTLLLGGIPRMYAVVLMSISCDETKLLINRFIEKGANEGEITVLITVEGSRWERLAAEHPNFNLFLCNPQAESPAKTLPNVVKIRGVENLTDVSIPIISTLRKFGAPNSNPRRICIEILSDILLQHHAVQTRKWLIGLISELKSKGFTILAVVNPQMHNTEEVQAVIDVFDGEIRVYEKAEQKLMQIRRMYEQEYIAEEMPLRKDRLSTTGVVRKLRYHNY
ncbi:MAG: ATPase domain-containing protein [Candidatus Bathyarchaeia archaeon]